MKMETFLFFQLTLWFRSSFRKDESPRKHNCFIKVLKWLGIIVNTIQQKQDEGYLTLEFSNSSGADCRIYATEGICHSLFEGDPCSTTYQDRRGKYQNQPEKVTLARPNNE